MIVPGSTNPLLMSGAPPAGAFLGRQTDSALKSSYTFALDLDDPAPGRIIAVVLSLSGNWDGLLSSVTIGGITATLAAHAKDSGSGTSLLCIAYAVVPSNANPNVVVTLATPKNFCSCAAYSIKGMGNTTHLYAGTANGSGVTSLSKTDVNSQSDGFMLAGIQSHNGPTGTTWTAGLTEDIDGVYASTSTLSTARLLATTTQNPKTVTATLNASSSSTVLGVVTWK